MIDALPLNPSDRDRRLEDASRKLIQDQQKNATARRCHTKKRQAQLTELGINLAELPCCVPR
jgi:hypothetical protein